MKKHHHFMQELSKFLAGLIFADFLVGVWLYFGGLLPMEFMGLVITEPLAVAGMVFDVILVLLLVHYGWHINIPSPNLKQKTFLYTVGILLSLVSALHLLRLIFGLQINIGPWLAPFWLSWMGTLVTGYLGYASLKFATHRK